MSCPFRLNELGKKDRYLASIRYHLKIHAGNKGYRYTVSTFVLRIETHMSYPLPLMHIRL